MSRPLVFISYSHSDQKEKDRLLTHLKILQNVGLIELWSDDLIGAGDNWEEKIHQAMARARIAVLLISANFLSSGFTLNKEIPILLERREQEELTIFPVIARPCHWRIVNWLAEMDVWPENGRPVWRSLDSQVDEDLTIIVQDIESVINYGSSRTRSRSAKELNPGRWMLMSLAEESLTKALEILARLMGISPQDIYVQRVSRGSIILDLNIPSKAVEHLQFHLQSNSEDLLSLEVHEVVFEGEYGEIEKWIVNLLPSRQFGYILISTSQGIMTHEEARRKKTGGKILGFFY